MSRPAFYVVLRIDPVVSRSAGMGAAIYADMRSLWVQATSLLSAANCDWLSLQQVESLLSSLATELEQAIAMKTTDSWNGSGARSANCCFHSMQRSLDWVREHEYDTLESDIQKHLNTSARCALSTLQRLEQSQCETRRLWLVHPDSVETVRCCVLSWVHC